MSVDSRQKIHDIVDLFLLDGQARRLTKSSIRFYRVKLGRFLRWCDETGLLYLQDITPTHLRTFLASLHTYSSHYQHGIARALRAWLNFCVRDELISSSPFDKVRMPTLPRRILPALDHDDLKTILSACTTPRDKAIVLFLLDSGVRATELTTLNGQDIADDGTVTIHQGKGQKDRVTYIGARTRLQLKRYFIDARYTPGGTEPLFISERDRTRLTVPGVMHLMRRLQKRSGVDICTAHTFRRTFAINCLRNGMNIYVLARLMGHSDITVLRQYLALVENDLKEAHDRFGAVDHLP